MSNNIVDFTQKKKAKEALEESMYVDASDIDDDEVYVLIEEFLDELEEDQIRLDNSFYSVANDFEADYSGILEGGFVDEEFMVSLDEVDDEISQYEEELYGDYEDY